MYLVNKDYHNPGDAHACERVIWSADVCAAGGLSLLLTTSGVSLGRRSGWSAGNGLTDHTALTALTTHQRPVSVGIAHAVPSCTTRRNDMTL